MGKGTVVLAYSGGLDTSICIPLLREDYHYDRVVTVAVNVGQRDEEIAVATEKGKKFADIHYTIDAREKFVDDYIFPAIRANGSYEGYPMGTSLARPLIADEVVKIARKEGAHAIAHGCTGKGNDQLRFDFIIRGAGLEVVAPIREKNLTRDWEIEYAQNSTISPCPSRKTNPGAWTRTAGAGASKGAGLKTLRIIRPKRFISGPSLRKRRRIQREKVTITF